MPREEHPALGVSYVFAFDQNDKDFPIIAVAHDPRTANYKPDAPLTPHPETGRYPTHKLTEIKTTTSDERVLWIYRMLPGPEIDGEAQNSNGAVGEITVQDVVAGTSAATGADILQSEVTPKDSVVSQKTTRDGALWSNTTGKALVPFGLTGSVSEGVVDKAAAASVSGGIDTESWSSDPQDALRNHERKITAPYSTTTVILNEVDERGDAGTETITWVAPDSSLPTESELSRVTRVLETKDRARQEVSAVSSRSALVSKDFDEFGGLETATQTIVAPTVVPANVGTTIERLRQTRKKEAELLSIVMTTGSIVDETAQEFSAIPGSRVVRQYYLVLASSSMPADTSTLVYRRLRHPSNPKLKIEIKADYSALLTLDYNETEDMSWPRPTLFYTYYSDDIQGTTRKQRSGSGVNIPHRVNHFFSTTKQEPSPVQIIEGDYLVFSVPVRGLIDSSTVTRTVHGVAYTQSIGPTSPSRTTYDGWVDAGDELLVGGRSKIIAAGIYHNEYYYVIAQ